MLRWTLAGLLAVPFTADAALILPADIAGKVDCEGAAARLSARKMPFLNAYLKTSLAAAKDPKWRQAHGLPGAEWEALSSGARIKALYGEASRQYCRVAADVLSYARWLEKTNSMNYGAWICGLQDVEYARVQAAWRKAQRLEERWRGDAPLGLDIFEREKGVGNTRRVASLSRWNADKFAFIRRDCRDARVKGARAADFVAERFAVEDVRRRLGIGLPGGLDAAFDARQAGLPPLSRAERSRLTAGLTIGAQGRERIEAAVDSLLASREGRRVLAQVQESRAHLADVLRRDGMGIGDDGLEVRIDAFDSGDPNIGGFAYDGIFKRGGTLGLQIDLSRGDVAGGREALAALLAHELQHTADNALITGTNASGVRWNISEDRAWLTEARYMAERYAAVPSLAADERLRGRWANSGEALLRDPHGFRGGLVLRNQTYIGSVTPQDLRRPNAAYEGLRSRMRHVFERLWAEEQQGDPAAPCIGFERAFPGVCAAYRETRDGELLAHAEAFQRRAMALPAAVNWLKRVRTAAEQLAGGSPDWLPRYQGAERAYWNALEEFHRRYDLDAQGRPVPARP